MTATNNVFRRASASARKNLGDEYQYFEAGCNFACYESIVTQVACEAADRIKTADAPTLRSVLRRFDRQGGLSEKTKRRLIEARLRALERMQRRLIATRLRSLERM